MKSIEREAGRMPSGGGPWRRRWRVDGYALGITLDSGQCFRWERFQGAGRDDGTAEAWEGVVHGRWVRLRGDGTWIEAMTVVEPGDWGWLADWLQVEVDDAAIRATFPPDPPLQAAVTACRGLRILRQEPWECLASFICSSNKRVVQIREMVRLLCMRLGRPVTVPEGVPAWHAFPSAERVAAADEAVLRGCKLGYRAPHLLATARRVAEGRVDLEGLAGRPMEEAAAELEALPGVGPKVARCVLLFACGFPRAFPVDVWIRRVLRDLYFPRARRVTPARLARFSATHFGPYGGHAQQYLFHHARTGGTARRGGQAPAPGADGVMP